MMIEELNEQIEALLDEKTKLEAVLGRTQGKLTRIKEQLENICSEIEILEEKKTKIEHKARLNNIGKISRKINRGGFNTDNVKFKMFMASDSVTTLNRTETSLFIVIIAIHKSGGVGVWSNIREVRYKNLELIMPDARFSLSNCYGFSFYSNAIDYTKLETGVKELLNNIEKSLCFKDDYFKYEL